MIGLKRLPLFHSGSFNRLFSDISVARGGIPSISAARHPYELITDAENKIPADARFAVVEFSGRQYKLSENCVFVADLIKSADIDQRIILDKVLLVGSKHDTYLGHPYIEDATVEVDVEEITKGEKVITFKKRRRKNSKRTRGFRRDMVTLRVKKINFSPELAISKCSLN